MEEKKMTPQQLYLNLEIQNDCRYVSNLGEGMSIAEKSPAREMYLINHNTHEAWMVRSYGGTLIQWTTADVDMEELKDVENSGNAHTMWAQYGFNIGLFNGGRAIVSWTLHPEGTYFADPDGFGMTDDEEVKVYGIVDTQCKIVKPFSLIYPIK